MNSPAAESARRVRGRLELRLRHVLGVRDLLPVAADRPGRERVLGRRGAGALEHVQGAVVEAVAAEHRLRAGTLAPERAVCLNSPVARLLQQLIEPPHPCSYLPHRSAQVEVRLMVDVTAAELDMLPYIGEVKAQHIIDHRPYAKPEDLMKVPGIKEGTFARLKDYITVQ